MRRFPIALLALLLASRSQAGTADWIRSERDRAAAAAGSGRYEEAVEILRPALAASRRAGLRTESARILLALASAREDRESAARDRGETPPDLATALYRAAAAEAAADGNASLELEALSRLAFLVDPESVLRDRLDAALATAHIQTLTELVFFNPELADHLALLDGQAEATLALARKDDDAAFQALVSTLAAAETARLRRFTAHLSLQLAELCNRTGRTPSALSISESAIDLFKDLGDLRGEARARVQRALALASKGDPRARAALDAAVVAALSMDDTAGEAEALGALATLVPAAEKEAVLARAARAEERERSRLLEEAERAVREGGDAAGLAARLREERRRRPTGAEECNRLLAALGEPADEARRPLSAAYAAALRKALASETPWVFASGLEILRRHDTWPLVADAAEASANPWVFADALETLALREDLPRLLKLVGGKDPVVAEAAAAAVFRLALPGDAAAVRKALAAGPGAAAALYLRGALARAGDAEALKALRDAAHGGESLAAHHACAILASLGFAGQVSGLAAHAETLPAGTAWRILARAPVAWGVFLTPAPESDSVIGFARAANVRGDRNRVFTLDEASEIWQAFYSMPRTPEESRICGTGWILRTTKFADGSQAADAMAWIGCGLGYDLFGGEERLRRNAESHSAIFALADLEEHRVGGASSTQVRTLTVQNGEAWARVRVTATAGIGDLTDNALHLPFAFVWDTASGHNGSLAGAIGQISLQITLAGLVPEASIDLPGFPAVAARVRVAGESLLWVDAELPMRDDGAGLGAGKVVPIEVLEKGTVTLRLKAENSRASMTFPLALLIPPAKDKPDLVASELTLEPRVPNPGEEVHLRLRTRNTGRTPDKDTLLNVRFQVLNPQTGEGRRTIDVRLTEARGWRPGEWRTFEARPTAVRGWYMNAWSPTWTLEMGDTRLLAVVDADGRLEEMAEDNNTVEVEVPLLVPEGEGKRLAEQEFLEQAQALLKKVGEATGEEQARVPGRAAVALFSRARFSTPEMELARRHVQAAVELQIYRLRVRAALAQASELAKNPKANTQKLRALIVELADAQTRILDSGIPAKEDVITWWRNRTQLAANQVGAAKDYADMAGIVGGPAGEYSEHLEKLGENLNRLDGTLQIIRYVRDRADGGEYDNSDPIEGTIAIFGGGNPGLGKLQQAIFKAEIDYVDKGFRKEAGALDAIADLISGKPGAEERLHAAVEDVGKHVSEGPFNEQARKEIVQGAIKDIPILGKLLDSIWSWK